MNLGGERVEVGRYLRRDQAEDRSLVLLALGMACWIEPDEGLYSLQVRPADAGPAARELAQYEEEKRRERREFAPEPAPAHAGRRRAGVLSLFLYVWVLAGFFLLQLYGPSWWQERGIADSRLILEGQAWRTVTALTLHADLGHLFANAAVGVLFAAALLPWLGTGWTWLGIVASGAAGNWLNAWGHRAEAHRSLGASTAVFGGLGLLVGWQLAMLVRHHAAAGERPPLRHLILPAGAGLALLAYLGVGDEGSRVDVTAHLFGMLCGGVFGFAIGAARLPERTSPAIQRALAALALVIPALAWLTAAP